MEGVHRLGIEWVLGFHPHCFFFGGGLILLSLPMKEDVLPMCKTEPWYLLGDFTRDIVEIQRNKGIPFLDPDCF